MTTKNRIPAWRDRLSRLGWWLPFGPVPEISPAALSQSLAQDGAELQLLDVRSPLEFRQVRLAEAVNVPIASFSAMVDTLGLDRHRPVVVICATAHRSIPAVRLLRRRGFQDVRQLAGGMIRWRQLKLPVELRTSNNS